MGLVDGPNTYAYGLLNPLTRVDPTGLSVGIIIKQILIKVHGRNAAEAAYAAKVFDVGVGAAAGRMSDCFLGYDIGMAVDVARGVGGAQAVGISTATTYGMYGIGAKVGSAGGWVVIPLGLAGWGGWEIGTGAYNLYERYRNNPLGADLYDLIHDRRLHDYSHRSDCKCE